MWHHSFPMTTTLSKSVETFRLYLLYELLNNNIITTIIIILSHNCPMQLHCLIKHPGSTEQQHSAHTMGENYELDIAICGQQPSHGAIEGSLAESRSQEHIAEAQFSDLSIPHYLKYQMVATSHPPTHTSYPGAHHLNEDCGKRLIASLQSLEMAKSRLPLL